MSRLTLLFLLSIVAYVSADSDFIEDIKNMQLFVLKKSCPITTTFVVCPAANPFFYHKCCDVLLNDCCFALQDWVTVLLLVLAVITVLSVIINCLCCICCRQR
ncbi:hypothetical protein PENTCL1PPCAC_19880 [Pristionchus entomophagus]|uniref:Uncharacterized protein n=1 Tax=Pristionchus entomophagus TaxID=358040 RepID=A0AAV5TTA2_9BILA|nr:hypothetical protein PENTCL1PPCAC_19880 [Pristionchus entomophagus]